MKKALMKRSKGEKDRWKLHKQITEKVSKIDEALQGLYLKQDRFGASLIHNLRKNLWEIQDIFYDLLIDGMSAKKILAETRR
jgi:hypothetical protein